LAETAADDLPEESGRTDNAGKPAIMSCCAREEISYLLGPENVHAVVYAGAHHGCNDHSKIAARFEQMDREKWISGVNIGV
jgi:hypothetical protein